MKDRTKEILKDGFGSLINNAACIRGAKSGPLWLTIVMFVLSVFLPVLPIFINQANIKGSSFLGSYSYGLERYVTSLAIDLKEEGYELGIGEDHLLSVNKDGNEINYAEYGSNKPFASYVVKTSDDSAKEQYGFCLYVSNAENNSDRKAVNNAVKAKKYALGTLNASDEAENVYTPSYMILFKNSVVVNLFANNSTKVVASSYAGDYKTMKATTHALQDLLTVTNKDGVTISQSLTNVEYTDGVLNNYKKFLNKSYETLKIKNMWGTSGIYLAIFFGLSVIMGFLMWVLTRGKKNPNNYYTPWLTAKIEARLGLAPAIITLVAGFFLTSQVPLIFILLLGLRVMWISMKELRPVQQ